MQELERKTRTYAERLSRMIQVETISALDCGDKSKFYRFREVLKELFPMVFSICEIEDFNGSFLLHWKGKAQDILPILLMNHQDVVEASGTWKYPPFSGMIADGKVWGRGTLDTKGGLWAMLQSAEELMAEGFTPNRDIYFMSTCTEETDGVDAEMIACILRDRGMRFEMVLDEGGMILDEPMDGVKGAYAVIGVGEKGCVDLKFIARSDGGHASTPGKNTPLVRLAKFMTTVEKKKLFKAKMSDTVCEMFQRLSVSMRGGMKFLLGHVRLFRPLLIAVMPFVSNTANAMLKTTVAFTMASGSDGANVLPQEAWVVANMRYSHHEGERESIRKLEKLAKKYNVETVVLDAEHQSSISDYHSDSFALIERGVQKIYPEVRTTPYVMNSASDCRYMSKVSENCLRFTPFFINNAQLDSIHGIDENVEMAALSPAVDFYRYIITEV